MAGIPLNVFKTTVKNIMRPWKIDQDPESPNYGNWDFDNTYFDIDGYPPGPNIDGNANFMAYKAPLGVTSVILYAHISTTATSSRTVSIWHYRPKLFPVGFTQILNEVPVPSNDALIAIGGKLVLETDDALYISSNSSDILKSTVVNDVLVPSLFITDVKLTLSILESANQ